MSSAARCLASSALTPYTERTQTQHHPQALPPTGSNLSSPLPPSGTPQQPSRPKHKGPWAVTTASATMAPMPHPSSSSCSSPSHAAAQVLRLAHQLTSCCKPTLFCRSLTRACFRLSKQPQQKLLPLQLRLHLGMPAQQSCSFQSHHQQKPLNHLWLLQESSALPVPGLVCSPRRDTAAGWGQVAASPLAPPAPHPNPCNTAPPACQLSS